MKIIADRFSKLTDGFPWLLLIAAVGWTLNGLVFFMLPPLPGSLATVSLAMTLFFVLPGFLVIATLRQTVSASPWGVLVVSFGVGLGIDLLVVFVVRLLGLPLAAIGQVLWLLEMPLLAILYTQWRRGILVSFQFSARSDRAKQADWIFLILLVPVVSLYLSEIQWAIPLGGPTDWPKYLNYTSWILAHPQAPSSDMPHIHMQWQANFRVWWVALAAITDLVKNDTTVLDVHWRYGPPILIALSVVAVYALACELFKRPGAWIASVIAHVAYMLGSLPGAFLGNKWIGYTVLYSSSEDKVLLSFLLIPIFCLLLIRFLQSREMTALLPLGLASLGAVLTHPLAFPFIALLAGSYSLLDWLTHPSRKVMVYAAATAVLLPLIFFPLLQRFSRSAALFDLDPTVEQESKEIIRDSNTGDRLLMLSDEQNSYIASPRLILYPVTLIGTLIGLGLGLRLRKSRSARFLFGATAMPLLIIYTPGLASLVGSIIGYDIFWRFVWLLPSGLALGWGLDSLANWLPRRLGQHRHTVSALGTACVVMVAFWGLGLARDIPAAVGILHSYNDGGVRYRTNRTIASYIAKLGKDGETILAPVFPSQTNRTIFAIAPDVHVVAWHRFSNIPLHDQIDRFYTHSQLDPIDVDLLKDNNVDYLVIPKNAPLVPFLSGAKFVLVGSVEGVNIYRANVNLDYIYFDQAYAQQDYQALATQIIEESGPEAAVVLDRPGPDTAGHWKALQKTVQRYFNDNYPDGPSITALSNNTASATLTQLLDNKKQIYVIFWGEGSQDPGRTVEHMLNENVFVTDTSVYGKLRLVRYQQLDEPVATVESETHFDKSITLKSFALTSESLSPGGILGVRLFWQTDSQVKKRYKVFVHLIDSNGVVISQNDSEPDGYLAPTDIWIPGEIIVDNHALVLPSNIPPDDYRLFVGLYTEKKGRLPIIQNMKETGDQVLLNIITVK